MGTDLPRYRLGNILLLSTDFCRALSDVQGDGISATAITKKLEDREIRQRALNFPNWHRRVNEWRDQVLDAAGVLSTNLRRHLQTLNETHGYPSDIQIVGGSHDGEHKLDLSVISETLRRL